MLILIVNKDKGIGIGISDGYLCTAYAAVVVILVPACYLKTTQLASYCVKLNLTLRIHWWLLLVLLIISQHSGYMSADRRRLCFSDFSNLWVKLCLAYSVIENHFWTLMTDIVKETCCWMKQLNVSLVVDSQSQEYQTSVYLRYIKLKINLTPVFLKYNILVPYFTDSAQWIVLIVFTSNSNLYIMQNI